LKQVYTVMHGQKNIKLFWKMVFCVLRQWFWGKKGRRICTTCGFCAWRRQYFQSRRLPGI